MATKKTNYPSVKMPGVYSDATDKELGLDVTDLKTLSLGSWNTIIKNSKLIVSTKTSDLNSVSEDPRGRPIRMKWGAEELLSFTGDMNDNDNTRANDSTNYPFASYFIKAERDNYGLFEVTKVYTGDGWTENDLPKDGNAVQSYAQLDIGDGTVDDGTGEGKARRQRQQKIINNYANKEATSALEFEITSMRKEVTYEDGFAYIKERFETSNVQGKYVIEFDDNLFAKIQDLIYIKDLGPDFSISPDINIDGNTNLDKLSEFEGSAGNTWEVVFPRFFTIQSPGDEESVTIELATSDNVIGPILPKPKIGNSNNSLDISDESNQDVLDKIFSKKPLLTFRMLNANDGYLSPFAQGTDEDEYFRTLGFPPFKYNGLLTSNIEQNKVYFDVLCTNQNGDDLLYWENGSEKYLDTSYPLEITLEMSLFEGNTSNTIDLEEAAGNVEAFDALTLSYSTDTSFNAQQFLNNEIKEDKNESFYRYRIIQWGDEKTLLSDDEIKNTYFFNFYDNEEYPAPNDYNILRYNQEIIYNSKSFSEKINHTYLTPGVKSIKIVVYRYSKTGIFITETLLVNKNIVINDGLFTSQDFSIFGTSEFDFLPIIDNQAIIGGFETESDYNNSVSKIVKDDNFIQDDYLKRVSSRDYINKINDGSLGKQPGQLDLGQTRVFTEPKDIYDFIGANKLEWINQGSGSLPVNSLATDIFIRDNKCVVDLNPSNTEYSAIQNQAGSEEIGILIGDYKINQSEGSSVQKQGVMETPLLETDNEKQAF